MAESAFRGLMATRTKNEPKKSAGEPKLNVGKVVQVIGPVLDVEFEPERLPERVVELGQPFRLELHVEHGTDDLDDFSDVQLGLARRFLRFVLRSGRHESSKCALSHQPSAVG